jgi:beta-lactam-binding protein with PASTA domain
VPVVIGKTAEEATKILQDAGFGNVKVVLDTGADATDADKAKLVVSVNPTQGSAVVGTTQIVLTVDSNSDTGNG